MLSFLVAAVLTAAPAGAKPASDAPTVVLVHGAFADASGWSKVITRLQAKGIKVWAVQLPETSLKEDVEATRRMIDAAKGPVVLVGHSYGGVVITAAAEGLPAVKGLVYVSALVPDEGESSNDLFGEFPSVSGANIVPQSGEFLWLDPAKFQESFCADIPAADARVMAVTQKPINKASFAEKTGKNPAWRTVPSWFLITTADHMVSPELQRFEAKRMNSRVTEVAASHTAFLSKPDAVAKVISSAVTGEVKKEASN